MTNYFKVGLGIIAMVAVLFIGYKTINPNKYTEKNSYTLTVIFENIQGLTVGNDVWLSGVSIGMVQDIQLREDGRAELTLQIGNKYQILKGSIFKINVAMLQDKNLSIEKPADLKKPYKYHKAGDIITNTKTPAVIPDIMNEANEALKHINDILEEVQVVFKNDKLQTNILQTTENIALATEEAFKFAELLRDTGMDNRDEIDATIANILKLTESLNLTAAKVDELLQNANDIAGDDELKQQIKDIVTTLKASVDNVKATTDKIKDIATDDEVEEDLRETIKSTRSTMENADTAIGSFTNMLEAINDTEFKPDFEFRYHTQEDLYYADMNVRIFPPNSSVFYLFGFDNLGEDKTTNLQFGVRGRPDMWVRFGLKNDALSVAAEYTEDEYLYMGTLSDPNDLRFNLRVGKRMTRNIYLMAGWESVLKKNGLSFGLLQRY